MKWFASLSTAAIPKRRFGHPSPQHPGSIEPNKPSEKKAHPRTNLKPAAFRPMPAFRSVFGFDWRSVSTVAFAHLAPDPSGALVRPAVTITPINALAPKSWCPHPPGGHAWSRSLMSAWTLAPSFRSAVTFRLALMLQPMFKGGLGGTYRARTSGTNPPHGRNRAACMISRPPTQNRAFAGKILTLCIPNRLIASRNACMERKSCHR